MKSPEVISANEEAHIVLGSLKLWIHGYQFPECQDYWDGNWVSLTAICDSGYSRVQATGWFLHLPELKSWMIASKRLQDSLKGEAALACMEPNLGVTLHAGSRGSLLTTVRITPDNMQEMHEFKFGMDQSYLPEFLTGCSKVLQ